jgi:hypothetical protein
VAVSFPVALGEHFSITPAVNYSRLLDAEIRDNFSDDDNLWAGVTFSCGF